MYAVCKHHTVHCCCCCAFPDAQSNTVSTYVLLAPGRAQNQHRGLILSVPHGQGIVVNGCIRDSEDIGRMAIGVKALATHPLKSSKRDPGQYVTCTGTRFPFRPFPCIAVPSAFCRTCELGRPWPPSLSVLLNSSA